jgi:hypothetical protein
VNRGLISLFRVGALIGVALSLSGLLLGLGTRAMAVVNGRLPQFDFAQLALFFLEVFRDAGTPFLLSAILYTLCDHTLKGSNRLRDPDG